MTLFKILIFILSYKYEAYQSLNLSESLTLCQPVLILTMKT
jgi:hypothetical protein